MRRLARSVRWRAGTTAAVLAVVAITVAVAFWAPSFAQSASDALVGQRVDERPASEVGLSWVSAVDGTGRARIDRAVDAATRLTAASRGTFERPTVALVGSFDPPGVSGRRGGLPLVWREDQCSHLRLSGRCPTAAGEVVVPAAQADRGWTIGSSLKVRTPMADPDDTGSIALQHTTTVRIVGTWDIDPAASAYWFDLVRFAPGSTLPTRATCDESPGTPTFAGYAGPFFTARSTFDTLGPAPGAVSVVADSRPAPRPGLADRAALVATTRAAGSTNGTTPAKDAPLCPYLVQDSDISSALSTIGAQQQRLATVGVVVALSLTLLCLFAVLLITAALATQRRGEVAIAKLRGMRGRRLALFVGGESLAVVLLGAVVGLALGVLLCHLTTSHWLRAGSDVLMPWTSWVLAAGVGVACAIVALIAQWSSARRTPSSLLARAGRRGPTSAALLSVQVVVIGLGVGLLAQVRSGADARGAWLPLSSPAVLGLAAAVVTAWAVTAVGAGWTARTAGRGSDACFLAARRLRRGVDTTAIVAPLVAALVVAVFAGVAVHASATWRSDTARVRNGAAVRIDSPRSAFGTFLATREADPRGRWLMAAEVSGGTGADLEHRGFADLSRWDRVAAPTMGPVTGARSAQIGRAFGTDRWDPITFTGTDLAIRASLVGERADTRVDDPLPLVISLDVLDARGDPRLIELRDPDRSGTFRGTASACARTCILRQLVLGEKGGADLTGAVKAAISSLTADDRPVDLRLRAGSWRAARRPGSDAGPRSITSLRVTGSDITVRADPATSSAAPAITPATTPAASSVVVGGGVSTQPSTVHGVREGPSLDGALMPVRVAVRARNLMLLGRVGELGDLSEVIMESNPEQIAARVYVLVRAHTPLAVLRSLRAHGVPTDGRRLGLVDEELAADVYAQGVRSLVVLAAGSVLVAFVLVSATLAEQRRRRATEAATLRVVGVQTRTVESSVRLEVAVALLVAASSTFTVAALCVWRALPSVPLVDRQFFDPSVDVSVPWLGLAVAVLGATVAALVGVTLVLQVTARQGRPGLLREGGD